MDISVVVSTYNRFKHLRRQLHCFNRQTHKSFEVIVADDGSNDMTKKWCKRVIIKQSFKFPLKYVEQEHTGFRLAAVRNLGTEAAQGKRILFTDNDCWHNKKSIAAHASKIDKNTIGIGCIHWINKKYSDIILNKITPLPTDESLLAAAAPERRAFKEPMALFVWGGNFSIDRDLLIKAGGHDATFNGYGGEEIDLALRLTRHFDKSNIEVLRNSIAFHLWHPRGDVHKAKSGQDLLSRRRAQGYYKEERLGSLQDVT